MGGIHSAPGKVSDATMKTVLCVLLVAFVAVHAKPELVAKDCAGGDAIVTLGDLTDKKEKGALDKTSFLKIVFFSSQDTHKQDPFDIDMHFEIRKKIGFWYPQVPQAIMDTIGERIKNKNVKYLGKSVFRCSCIFKDLYKTCLPPKGPHTESVNMGPIFKEFEKAIGVVKWFGSGWYKVKVKATKGKEIAFCVDVNFKLSL